MKALALAAHTFGYGATDTWTPIFRAVQPPKHFGMSRECARLVRKNRLRRAGLAGQRI